LIKINIKQQIFVNLSIEDIFCYISNLDNLVDWSSATMAVKKLSPGEIHVGAIVHSTIYFLGKWLDMTFEVVECYPNRCITMKSISSVAPGLFCYQFEPGEDGGTIIVQDVEIQYTRERPDLTESAVVTAVRRQIEYDMVTLKATLEARASTDSASLVKDHPHRHEAQSAESLLKGMHQCRDDF
jgi:hypothetical protein